MLNVEYYWDAEIVFFCLFWGFYNCIISGSTEWFGRIWVRIQTQTYLARLYLALGRTLYLWLQGLIL